MADSGGASDPSGGDGGGGSSGNPNAGAGNEKVELVQEIKDLKAEVNANKGRLAQLNEKMAKEGWASMDDGEQLQYKSLCAYVTRLAGLEDDLRRLNAPAAPPTVQKQGYRCTLTFSSPQAIVFRRVLAQMLQNKGIGVCGAVERTGDQHDAVTLHLYTDNNQNSRELMRGIMESLKPRFYPETNFELSKKPVSVPSEFGGIWEYEESAASPDLGDVLQMDSDGGVDMSRFQSKAQSKRIAGGVEDDENKSKKSSPAGSNAGTENAHILFEKDFAAPTKMLIRLCLGFPIEDDKNDAEAMQMVDGIYGKVTKLYFALDATAHKYYDAFYYVYEWNVGRDGHNDKCTVQLFPRLTATCPAEKCVDVRVRVPIEFINVPSADVLLWKQALLLRRYLALFYQSSKSPPVEVMERAWNSLDESATSPGFSPPQLR